MITRRSRIVATAALLLSLVGAACAPPPPPEPAEPPPLAAIVFPSSLKAGAATFVIPPDNNCLTDGPPFVQYLEAAVTIPTSGVVVARGTQTVTPPAFSEFANPDPTVRVAIPRTVAPGRYLVYLSCASYLYSYEYSPATLTVLP